MTTEFKFTATEKGACCDCGGLADLNSEGQCRDCALEDAAYEAATAEMTEREKLEEEIHYLEVGIADPDAHPTDIESFRHELSIARRKLSELN